jgi:hypothetical protein
VTATNSGGSNSADSAGLAIPAGGGGGGGGSGGGGGGGTTDTTPPSVSGYALSATAFRAASSGGSVAAKKPPVGTRVKYTLSEASMVTFSVTKTVAGRKRRGKCEKPSKRNRRGKACKLTVALGSFAGPGNAGADSFKFTGRLKGRKLPPGRYKLVLVAKDAAGNKSKSSSKPFKIVR